MINMLRLKISCVILLYVVALSKCESAKDEELNESYCDGTGWVSFKDEKCFKLVKKPLTRDEAKDVCEQEESKLVSIKSAAEQDYLTDFIFDKSAVVVNVWIGAIRRDENEFVWDDSTKVKFNNWAANSPTSEAQRGCIVMQAEFTRELLGPTDRTGKWRDVICEQWNFAVCEKLQKWSIVKLQQTILNTRKDLGDSLDQVTDELNATKNELSQTKTRLSSAEIEIDNSKRNSVPIGFIYVQLPDEKTPTEIWPFMQWTDVSTTYAGVFFRVNGGGAAAFGQVQEENSPRLAQVRTGSTPNHPPNTSFRPYNVNSPIPKTGWSNGIPMASWCCDNSVYITFEHSSGEIRPRNMAIRVWKRTS